MKVFIKTTRRAGEGDWETIKKGNLEELKEKKNEEGEEKKEKRRGASDAEGDTKHLAGRVYTVNGYTGRHHEPLLCVPATPLSSNHHRRRPPSFCVFTKWFALGLFLTETQTFLVMAE